MLNVDQNQRSSICAPPLQDAHVYTEADVRLTYVHDKCVHWVCAREEDARARVCVRREVVHNRGVHAEGGYACPGVARAGEWWAHRGYACASVHIRNARR